MEKFFSYKDLMGMSLELFSCFNSIELDLLPPNHKGCAYISILKTSKLKFRKGIIICCKIINIYLYGLDFGE